MKNATMTVRMSSEIKDRLNKLANATHRTKSYILDQAINQYLNAHEWQVLDIEKAVKYADSPEAEWVDHEDMKAKWEAKLEC